MNPDWPSLFRRQRAAALFRRQRAAALFRRQRAEGMFRRQRTEGLFRHLRAAQARLVVVAPHPDDETLGAGLLIRAAVRAGVAVAVVALTDGQASHPGSKRWPPPALGRLRRGEMARALARLGAGRAPVRFMGWADGRLAGEGSALRLRRVLGELRAGAVAVASPADHHADHKAAFALVRAAAAVPVLSYAVWSRLAVPGERARAAGVSAKRWAMAAHRSQLGGYIRDDPGGFAFDAVGVGRLVFEGEVWEVSVR